MNAPQTLATPHRAKLRVSDFLLLSEAGAFADYARSELIEGEIWVVNAVHRRHARIQARLTGMLFAALEAMDSGLEIYATPSTELSDDSLPEPDILLADPTAGALIPGSATRLAVEIADSTLDFDLGRKARLYARHGIPEYWVADVEGQVVHQMWAPKDGAYAERRIVPFGERLAAATIDGLIVETDKLSGA